MGIETPYLAYKVGGKAIGKGTNKKQAEQNAAAEIVAILESANE